MLQQCLTEWYHCLLCHLGETWTEQMLHQQFYWKNMHDTVIDICSKCHSCQKNKKSTKKYGHLPAKEAQANPWDVLCVDLIGPYTIKCGKHKKNLKPLWCITMIDPATGWFEMREKSQTNGQIL